MPILAAHFERLKERFPEATLTRLPSGAALVTVPGCPVQPGWPVPKVTIRFLAPNGYPVAKPDCFWVEPKLSLNGQAAVPKNSTYDNQIAETAIKAHWFSWHIDAWSPNRHDFLTWLNICFTRLQQFV